jgi:hypothetical protein
MVSRVIAMTQKVFYMVFTIIYLSGLFLSYQNDILGYNRDRTVITLTQADFHMLLQQLGGYNEKEVDH